MKITQQQDQASHRIAEMSITMIESVENEQHSVDPYEMLEAVAAIAASTFATTFCDEHRAEQFESWVAHVREMIEEQRQLDS